MLIMSKMRINSTIAMSVDGFCTHCMSYFKVNSNNAVLLFEGWKISSAAVLVGSCIGVFFLSMLSECVRSMRSKLSSTKSNVKPHCLETESRFREDTPNVSLNFGSTETLQSQQQRKENKCCSPFTIQHMVQAFLHIAQLILGYFLMLIVMTFNVWLGMAVVLGLGTGYFLCNRSEGSILQSNVSFPMKIVQ